MKLSELCCFLLAGTTAVCASAYKKEPNFLNARRNGGLARIVLRVVDDESSPVADTKVRVFMGMNFRERGYWLEGTTDTNGVFMIDGKTTGNEIEIDLSKDGYYDSKKKLCFIKMGAEHNVEDGKWQPYGAKLAMRLRPIKKPLKLRSVQVQNYKFTEETCEWIGYDLEMNDFVKPHGKGMTADFEVYLDWDKVYSLDCRQIGFKIRFVEPWSGYYEVPVDDESELSTPYNAEPCFQFLQKASFYDRYGGERIRNTFDKSKCWVIRSRCKIDEQGRLISANYSVARFLGISGSCNLSAGFCFLGAFNPTLNDTNLEDDALYQQYKRFRGR